MIKTSTPNDVIRYLYGELSEFECEEFMNILKQENDNTEILDDFENLRSKIDACSINPPQRVIDSILLYSKNYYKNKTT
ncbi:MAG: hypothetical protein OEY34_10770 [Cyclobacteriaceae bacterium]|nr:hypothetical protein [Cyclobacteriaceae bacterium]